MNSDKIVVLGAGVIGLTSAILLQESGHTVEIVSADLPPNNTSDKAAAIWSPYRVDTNPVVLGWSNETFHTLKNLSSNPDSGVKMIEALKFTTPEKPNWLNALPIDAVREAQAQELPNGYHHGYFVQIPFVDVKVYLPYLINRFLEKGRIIHQQIDQIEPLLQNYHYVINCTGLGSKKLIGDSNLYPIQGHIVQVENRVDLPYLDDCFNEELTYIFPRADGCLLGGTAVENDENLKPDPKVIEGILKRCTKLEPRLKGLKVVNQYVGLRPGRKQIRLEKERDKNIIHNYGHGGAGFTLSWGSAKAVLDIME